MSVVESKHDQLLQLLRTYESCAVAYSGGVDSAVVAKAAHMALGDAAIAVTGSSASLAEAELVQARELASLIGIRHVILDTNEFANPEYLRNAPDRCYHCKTELYTQMDGLAEKLGVAVIVNGTNVDDLGDYRPGLTAATEHEVRSPLAECGIGKAGVRELAARWGLPVWDKPASPCLSSRIAYGVQVTPERLAMVDRAEQYVRQMGLAELRVRYHDGDLARIEVPVHAIVKLCEPDARRQLTDHLKSLGFKFITIDLEGFRSGSLNQIVNLAPLLNS